MSSKNARNRRNRPCLSRTVAGLVLVALTAACDSPTAPRRDATAPTPNPTRPTETRPDLSGAYTLTLSASSRCASELPEAVRTRTYPATIAQTGGALVVTVPMSVWVGWTSNFKGELGETNDVVFELWIEDWSLLVGPTTETDFYAKGRMTATISTGGLSGFLDGEMAAIVFKLGAGGGPERIGCTAPDHSVKFSR